jgi:hypothetical protein
MIPTFRNTTKPGCPVRTSEIAEYDPVRADFASAQAEEEEELDCTKSPTIPPRRPTCSKRLRDFLLTRLPAAASDRALWLLLGYLLLDPRFDKGDGRILLCANILAAVEGQLPQWRSRNYKAWRILQRLKKEVLPDFEWLPFDQNSKRCRRVGRLGLPEDVARALEEEWRTPAAQMERWVYYDTGAVYNRRSRCIQREEARTAAQKLRASAEATERVLRYMNGLDPNRFTRILKHVPEALDYALGIEEVSKRHKAIAAIRAIEEQPQPFYQPSRGGQAVRVFPSTVGLLSVKSAIRRILTQDWMEFDLRASQFAINAVLWGNGYLVDLLLSGKDIWEMFYSHLCIDPRSTDLPRVKKVLKSCCYAVHFGKSAQKVAGELNNSFLSSVVQDAGERFICHPVISSVLKHREREMKLIEAQGGAEDCFGQWLRHRQTKGSDTNIRSILALRAQALELKLLLPVFDLAEGTDEFDVILFQHDGFTAAFRDESKRDRWKCRIQEAVAEEAQQHGVPTYLVA